MPDIRPIGLVLRAETEVMAVRGVVERQVSAVRVDGRFDVVGVIAKIDPRLAISGFAKGVVNGCDVRRSREVGDVAAELPEVGAVDVGVPVEFLPGASGIGERSADWWVISRTSNSR